MKPRTLATAALCATLLLSGCSSSDGAGSATKASDLLAAMQQDINAKCSTSGLRTCLEVRLGYAYPGSVDADAARTCIAAKEEDPKYQFNVAFDQDTLTRADGWVADDDAMAKDWMFGGKTPGGATYTVAIREIVILYGVEATNNYTGHITVKDGNVYWFPSFCQVTSS